MLAARPLGKTCIVVYYYGSPVYDYLSSGSPCFTTYGESMMRVTKEAFLKCANRLPETVTDTNVVQHTVYIVPAPLCAGFYVNESWHSPEDEATEGARL